MEQIKVENLTFKYPLSPKPALTDINLTINEGEFVVLCGATGSGKSTLLRLLKQEISPRGEMSGKVHLLGNDELTIRESAQKIGFVVQNPAEQLVTDKVWHELAFGLENLGCPPKIIAGRIAEIAGYFGIEEWYERPVAELSGGQQQLLNLAAVMTMNPEILILDEPSAQLDPIAASEFFTTLKKLNNDFAMTIIIAEHRLEELIPISDRLIIMENGKIKANDSPEKVISLIDKSDNIFSAVPAASRLFIALNGNALMQKCPLTIREGRDFIRRNYSNAVQPAPCHEYSHSKNAALSFKNVFFRYERDSKDILKDADICIYQNEIYSILGGNGSGKSTLLKLASGILKPYSGTIKVFDKKIKDYKGKSLYTDTLSLLPQNVQSLFSHNSVREELADEDSYKNLPFDITGLLDSHPYDLSGGEQQLLALAKVLEKHPRILLMDEPTKGLDAEKKAALGRILKELKSKGSTIVIVSHDVEFSAVYSDRCGLFFNGGIITENTPELFFSENKYYTTAAARMSSGYYERTVTLDALQDIINKNRN
ncbi:MAG: ATP-binding cassette domain-containing protein [Lachnospiraceae bacterium]|nr:ATP-binding cassette domain-containing protein [Lachnospiraceae bacterium]